MAPCRWAVVGIALAGLAGCSLFEDDEVLEGNRLPVRQAVAQPGLGSVTPRPLPRARTLEAWAQSGGNAASNVGHVAGPTGLSLAWRVDAGTGSSDDSFVTARPLAFGARVYTLDAAAQLTAFSAASGEESWQASLVPNEEEDGEEGFGGGLATDGTRLFATTGFGEVLALDPTNGEVLWRQAFGAPFRAAPAVEGGRVVAATRTSLAVALDARTGQVLWRAQGVTAETGFLGGASPAIAGGGAVVPFPSGELVALDLATGRRFWSAVLTGGRRGLARSAITDLTGDPVIAGNLVIVANQSGRAAALEAQTGRRVWTRDSGSTEPIWPAGDTLFLVSDTQTLMRLDRATGQPLWQRQLPQFEDEEDREDPIGYSGPVLVSGRLIFGDSLGQVWSVNAETGEGEPVAETDGGATTGPIVAGSTVYILSDEAVLHAFR